ncbi:MAG: hypothetical protein RMA76_30860 [Deltaproteobacteria bacterium]|jgi:4-hydroxy 2-oxovalerate aldolase
MQAELLETTIRDGSYEVDFQFTKADLALLVGLLDRAGLKYIEIGHGWGIRGQQWPGSVPAAETDGDYMRAARRAAPNAKIGSLVAANVFEEPVLREIFEEAIDNGLDFIRMACTPKSIPDREATMKSIEYAAKRGLLVSVNFMRSYLRTPEQMADKCRAAAEAGASWVYLVDSAGCWTPDEVKRYVAAAVAKTDARVGFHGHNNLGLATANSIAAIQEGATLVDASLQGLGRATGNAETERLLALMQGRLGLEPQIDRRAVNAIGRDIVRPWIGRGFDPTFVETGLARVHSGTLRQLNAVSADAELHVDTLIPEVARIAEPMGGLEGLRIPEEAVEEALGNVKNRPPAQGLDRVVDNFAAEASSNVAIDPTTVPRQARAMVAKYHAVPHVIVVPQDAWPARTPTWLHSGGAAYAIVAADGVAKITFDDRGYAFDHVFVAPGVRVEIAGREGVELRPIDWGDVVVSALVAAAGPGPGGFASARAGLQRRLHDGFSSDAVAGTFVLDDPDAQVPDDVSRVVIGPAVARYELVDELIDRGVEVVVPDYAAALHAVVRSVPQKLVKRVDWRRGAQVTRGGWIVDRTDGTVDGPLFERDDVRAEEAPNLYASWLRAWHR